MQDFPTHGRRNMFSGSKDNKEGKQLWVMLPYVMSNYILEEKKKGWMPQFKNTFYILPLISRFLCC